MAVPNIFANQSGSVPLAELDANFAAFQASNGAGLVGTILPSTGAVARTQLQKNADDPSVGDFGAVGNGSTNDTTAFSKAAASGLDIDVPITGSNYVVGAVTATLPFRLHGYGPIGLAGATAGFQLGASMAGVRLTGLVASGDGVVGNLNRLIWNDQSHTISDVMVTNVRMSNGVQNFDFGKITELAVIGCSSVSAQGTSVGQGYGIVMGSAKRARVVGNFFYANQRVSLYQSDVEYVSDVGNVFYQHAGTTTNAAHAVARSFKGVAVVGEVIAESAGVGLTIDSDNTAIDPGTNAIVSGCVFHDNVSADILIGSQTPSGIQNIKGVTVANSTFHPTATRQNGFITIVSGKNLTLNGLNFVAESGSVAAYTGINIDSSAGDSYFDVINILNCTGRIRSSSNDGRLVTVGSEICVGSTILNILGCTGVDCDTLIAYNTEPPTNPNIRTDWQFEKPLTLAAGAQALSIAGYNNFVLTGDGGGSSVSNFTNAYDGKVIRLRFVDANVTLTASSSLRLAGGANFVSTNYDTIELKYNTAGTFWYELNRSVNA